MTVGDVRTDIGWVLIGASKGRHDDQEIVVFESIGTAVQDTVAAAAVYLASPEAATVDLWSAE